jgi:acetyl esterase
MTYSYDPEIAPFLEVLPPLTIDDPVAARAGFEEMAAQLNADLDASGVQAVDRRIKGADGAPEVPVRVYTPEALSGTTAGLLYIHGGGFVVGSLETEHATCVALCQALGIVLVSVDYRLSPETAYPGALEDCYAGLQWLHANSAELRVDPARIGIFGLSAGGCLAAATTLLARDRSGPAICFQFLCIPELDDRLETPSMQQFTDTPMWNRPNAELSWDYYLGEQYRRGADDVPYHAAPARAPDLSGLPPTYVSTMQFDPLRDEGVLYALRLLQAGVATELHSFPGTFHGSILLKAARVTQRELAEMVTVLARALGVASDK